MNTKGIITGIVIGGILFSTSLAEEPIKRRPYRIPLPLITLLFNSENTFEEAFVTFNSTGEGWAIGPVNDRYVKDTPKERLDHFYREMSTSAHYVSHFEAKLIDRVCKKLEETLVIFERDLKHKQWNRLVFLDSQFPTFMRGFFYLYCAAHNSFSALPKVTRVADTLFEADSNSPKSDKRIATWRANPEHVVKLRIATKELIYQMKEWRSKVLSGTEEFDPRRDKAKKFRETYELFVRLYFNLPPASVIKKKIF